MNAKISEIFYSIQMEGSYIGYPAIFIRFSGCNLNCDFCDTKYALKDGRIMSSDEIHNSISSFNANRIIFTGGEPALHDDFMNEFMLIHKEYDYFLETNGTIFIKNSIKGFNHVVVSPKFSVIDEAILELYKKESNSVEFKFIINDENDIKEAETLSDKLNLYPVILQPLFDNRKPVDKYIQKTKKIIETFKKSDFSKKNARIIIQNQKIIYKEKRGV